MPFRLVYPVLAVSLVAVAVLAASATWQRVRSEGSVPRSIALAMLPLAGIAGLAFLVEGSMETWSAIYLRDVLGAAAFVGALGPGAFHAAMLVGRLIGAGVAGSLGAPATLLVSGTMTVGGHGRRAARPGRGGGDRRDGDRRPRRLVRGAGGRQPRGSPRGSHMPVARPRTS